MAAHRRAKADQFSCGCISCSHHLGVLADSRTNERGSVFILSQRFALLRFCKNAKRWLKIKSSHIRQRSTTLSTVLVNALHRTRGPSQERSVHFFLFFFSPSPPLLAPAPPNPSGPSFKHRSAAAPKCFPGDFYGVKIRERDRTDS